MGHLSRCHADTHWKVCPCQQQPDEQPAPPLAELETLTTSGHSTVMQGLLDVIAALTTTVAVHPDDMERVQAAVDDLRGCGPVRVVGSPAVARGQALLMGDPNPRPLPVALGGTP